VLKKCEFVERGPAASMQEEPGLKEFLDDSSLTGDAIEEKLSPSPDAHIPDKRPTPLYYYRELQSLRTR